MKTTKQYAVEALQRFVNQGGGELLLIELLLRMTKQHHETAVSLGLKDEAEAWHEWVEYLEYCQKKELEEIKEIVEIPSPPEKED